MENRIIGSAMYIDTVVDSRVNVLLEMYKGARLD